MCMRTSSLLATLVFTGAAVAQRPNILIAISDDQSYPHASAYGCAGIETPSFDRIAEAGVLFTRAFTPAPGCSPMRAAFLTGRHIWQLEAAGRGARHQRTPGTPCSQRRRGAPGVWC